MAEVVVKEVCVGVEERIKAEQTCTRVLFDELICLGETPHFEQDFFICQPTL